jgi:hypothetical protein
MKKVKLLLMSIAVAMTTSAQVDLPELSPRTSVTQKVGLTNFELEYSRPSVRDRKVFGEVIEMGSMWRTGANKNSMLTFDTDIKFGGQDVKAGTYAIFTKIEEKEWTVYLYTETENWGVPKEWKVESVIATVKVASKNDVPKQETFSITFENIGTEKFDLVFAWDTRKVVVGIDLPAKEMALASIEKTMAGPSDRDYYLAASYYLDEKTNLELALEYIKKAVEARGDEAFWYTRKQALIEFELGDKKAAIASAKRSLEAAKKANYTSYIKMNEESIADWSK